MDLAALAETLKSMASEPRLRLLQFLSEPHYLEEIATFLGMARQSAQHHVDRLLEVGAIEKKPGHRETGPVTEYVVAPHNFFALGEDMFRLGTLGRRDPSAGLELTREGDASSGGADRADGPGLVEVNGMNRGTIHGLDGPGPWVVGRVESREIPLVHDRFASGRHAKVVVEGSGHALIDMFSTNGTAVNWVPLAEGTKRVLSHGDIVAIGKTVLVYWSGPVR